MTETTMTLSALLTALASVVTQFISWLPTMVSTAIQIPLVQFFLGVSVVAVVIGFAKRLLRVK